MRSPSSSARGRPAARRRAGARRPGSPRRPWAGTQASGASVTAPLDGALAQGTYVVAWRVVSADGHPCGARTPSRSAAESDVSGLAGGALRRGRPTDRDRRRRAAVLAYLGVLGSCGVVLVSAVLRRPDEPTPVARWVGAGAVVALVSLVLQAVALAALATGEA
ncbi:MAG: copper resistance protein CopC [Acidimicrobiales bacterium]